MTIAKLTVDNYLDKVLKFRDRQAGVSIIYDAEADSYSYNAYCLETKLIKELFTVEFDFLDDALNLINDEFGSWELSDLGTKKNSGCDTCVAKK
jgi:hypothetical protein